MSMKKSAVCYLSRTPDADIVEFAEALARDPRISSTVDIHIIIDDNSYQVPSNPLVKFLQINNNECISNGYHSSNKIDMNKDCIAWDKVLYYFCQVKRNDYAFVWIVEDDSFIPSVDAFVSLHEKYSKEGNGDLICQKNDENLYGDTSGWKWADVVGKFSPPWYHSMMCAIGCSRRLLDGIANYVQQRRFLPFIEYLFNTIAMQNHMKLVNPPELSTIVYRENWTWEHVRERPNNWFHPVKSEHIRREYRLRLTNAWQEPAPNVQYAGITTEYRGPIIYQAPPEYPQSAPHPGQVLQYPYYTPPTQGSNYCPPPPPANSGSVLPHIIYPHNTPPPYPPH